VTADFIEFSLFIFFSQFQNKKGAEKMQGICIQKGGGKF